MLTPGPCRPKTVDTLTPEFGLLLLGSFEEGGTYLKQHEVYRALGLRRRCRGLLRQYNKCLL